PRPRMHVDFEHVQVNGRLACKGGKPHQVEWMYSIDDTMQFARGRVSHADHSTLHLDVWHRVVQNNEAERQRPQQRQSIHVAYIERSRSVAEGAAAAVRQPDMVFVV